MRFREVKSSADLIPYICIASIWVIVFDIYKQFNQYPEKQKLFFCQCY